MVINSALFFVFLKSYFSLCHFVVSSKFCEWVKNVIVVFVVCVYLFLFMLLSLSASLIDPLFSQGFSIERDERSAVHIFVTFSCTSLYNQISGRGICESYLKQTTLSRRFFPPEFKYSQPTSPWKENVNSETCTISVVNISCTSALCHLPTPFLLLLCTFFCVPFCAFCEWALRLWTFSRVVCLLTTRVIPKFGRSISE